MTSHWKEAFNLSSMIKLFLSLKLGCLHTQDIEIDMTLMTSSIFTLCMMTSRISTLGITTLRITKSGITTFGTTITKILLSIKGSVFMLSAANKPFIPSEAFYFILLLMSWCWTLLFSISKKYSTQHNDIVVMQSDANKQMCWVSLCWMLLCWVSWRH